MVGDLKLNNLPISSGGIKIAFSEKAIKWASTIYNKCDLNPPVDPEIGLKYLDGIPIMFT